MVCGGVDIGLILVLIPGGERGHQSRLVAAVVLSPRSSCRRGRLVAAVAGPIAVLRLALVGCLSCQQEADESLEQEQPKQHNKAQEQERLRLRQHNKAHEQERQRQHYIASRTKTALHSITDKESTI
jgi:hypothetical protein